jgi:hypothetical protein
LSRHAISWIVLIAVVFAVGAYWARRATVRAFFVDGGGTVALPAPGPGVDAAGLDAVDHVRVVLLDGLSRDVADTLPNFAAWCNDALALEVDDGFPTVSLPVQHVLWTGLTQQQSGLWYRIPRIDPPPAASLPARVPGSVGVAENHPDIVGSFGFERASPRPGEEWSEQEFVAAAADAIASDAPLAFVHVLRIDVAGHAEGADSESYRQAAIWADERLAHWLTLAPEGTRWFVLADHGHLPGGGHGGAEPEIRIVRACVAGGLDAQVPKTGSLLLIDLSRALADSLGRSPDPEAAGRPLEAALERPELGSTLPRPSEGRWAAATLVLAVGLGLARGFGARTGARAWAWAPWWLVLAYASLIALHGSPTLSNPVIYPPYGLDMLLAGLPGFVLLGVLGWRMAPRGLGRYAGAQLATVGAIALAFSILCGAPQLLLGLTRQPPLMPTWTAHTSVALSWCLGSGLTLALVGVAVAATRRHAFGRG